MMDRRTGGWMDGRRDGYINRWVDGLIAGRMSLCSLTPLCARACCSLCLACPSHVHPANYYSFVKSSLRCVLFRKVPPGHPCLGVLLAAVAAFTAAFVVPGCRAAMARLAALSPCRADLGHGPAQSGTCVRFSWNQDARGGDAGLVPLVSRGRSGGWKTAWTS